MPVKKKAAKKKTAKKKTAKKKTAKKKTATGMKTKATGASVSAFLRAVTDERRRKDCQTVLEMMKQATGEAPKMWGASIVGFGQYRYEYASGRTGEWPITGFSPRKNELSIYIMPGFEGARGLMAKLGKHKTGKSCLYVKRLEDVDQGVLRRLIEASVREMRKRYPG